MRDEAQKHGRPAVPEDIAALEARLGEPLDPAYRACLEAFGALRVRRVARDRPPGAVGAECGDRDRLDDIAILGVGKPMMDALEREDLIEAHRSWSGATPPREAIPVVILGGPDGDSQLGELFVHLPNGSVARPFRGRLGRDPRARTRRGIRGSQRVTEPSGGRTCSAIGVV